ncbi:hypothetical protein PGTUg99_007814 [Puccinia graminis f. sp. tritici]|uniref:Uncharacterized protein n=1 Tax=Puccinia graminis f. sp. tritici TaxID=56615 RepID=A0A5B0PD34_PUCGR|nr:hypothetical protein PGTUg99_007814 [Puccinia graminis f. sp. tritici]
MMDNLDPNYYHDSHHLDVHPRPSSRASSRVHDFDSISRPTSRSGSIRANYREPAEQIPHINHINNDALLSARLESAALNSEINGGRKSRANSRLDPMDDYREMDNSHLSANLNAMNLNGGGGRSRANSCTEMHGEDFLRSARSQLGNDFETSSNMGSMHSRSNSHVRLSNNKGLSLNPCRDLACRRSPGGTTPSELACRRSPGGVHPDAHSEGGYPRVSARIPANAGGYLPSDADVCFR